MREEMALARTVEGSSGSRGSRAGGCVPPLWHGLLTVPRAGGRLIFGSILLACLLLLISSPPARAACRLGLIDSDTTWRRADSPCLVDQGVAVMQGVTLAIEPGVVVKVKTDLAIQIDGTLIARGTPTAPITFTSHEFRPAPGDWGYVYFSDTGTDATLTEGGDYSRGSILEYCIVEYAGKDRNGNLSAVVRLDRSSPFIGHCTLRNNLGNGISATALDRPLSTAPQNSVPSGVGWLRFVRNDPGWTSSRYCDL